MPKNEQNLKWPCEYCTYENWPSAIKCALCLARRPAHVICPQPHRTAGISQDIYQAADNERANARNYRTPNNGDRTSPRYRPCDQEAAKWKCTTCTFDNWPSSLQCVMCHTSKSKGVKNALHAEDSSTNDERTRSVSPKTSRAKVDMKAINNDKNKAQVKALQKWECPHCTYQNWPKTVKCVICASTKPSIEEISVSKGKNTESRKPSGSRRRSPISSVSDLTLQSTNKDVGNIIYDIPASEDVNDNEEVLQIRNRLNDNDWMWLSACIGIVEGDATSVETYLNSGNDRTRQLTREECLVLNRPEAFEVGYTLVHLAIKFKREDLLAYLLVPEVSNHRLHCVPCLVCPELATDIRKDIAHTMRQRKGDWPCYFFTDQVTFVLPAG